MTLPAEVITQQAESTAQAVETELTAASAAAELTETPTDPGVEAGQKPPEKGGVQRRIDELTKARRLAEAESEFWKQKALASPTRAESAPEPDAKELKEPNLDDYDGSDGKTTADYLKDARAYDREVFRREMHSELQKVEQKRERQTEQEILADEWGEKESPVEKEHPDYADVTAGAMEAIESSKGPAKAALAHAIQYSEAGPELLYYLGQHPEEVQKLTRLHPTQAVLALGRIEARLEKEPEGGEPPASQTPGPKPITPIRKVATHDDGELRDDLPMGKWAPRFLKKMENK